MTATPVISHSTKRKAKHSCSSPRWSVRLCQQDPAIGKCCTTQLSKQEWALETSVALFWAELIEDTKFDGQIVIQLYTVIQEMHRLIHVADRLVNPVEAFESAANDLRRNTTS